MALSSVESTAHARARILVCVVCPCGNEKCSYTVCSVKTRRTFFMVKTTCDRERYCATRESVNKQLSGSVENCRRSMGRLDT